jgi:hypothetical protein
MPVVLGEGAACGREESLERGLARPARAWWTVRPCQMKCSMANAGESGHEHRDSVLVAKETAEEMWQREWESHARVMKRHREVLFFDVKKWLRGRFVTVLTRRVESLTAANYDAPLRKGDPP